MYLRRQAVRAGGFPGAAGIEIRAQMAAVEFRATPLGHGRGIEFKVGTERSVHFSRKMECLSQAVPFGPSLSDPKATVYPTTGSVISTAHERGVAKRASDAQVSATV
jgi:hypothetical protein